MREPPWVFLFAPGSRCGVRLPGGTYAGVRSLLTSVVFASRWRCKHTTLTA